MTDRLSLSDDEITRYARQLILPEIGDDGQDAIRATKLCVIGAGGLGVPVIMLAACAGFGHISILDDDVIESTNLNRQFIYTPDEAGRAKADIAAKKAQDFNADITITAHPMRFSEKTADDIIASHDIIIDASDNPATRYLANDIAVKHQKAHIFLSAIRFEGMCAVFAPHLLQETDEKGVCYRCLFPHQPEDGSVPNCATVGVVAPITTSIAAIGVIEAIKLVTASGQIGKSLLNHLLLYDLLHHQHDVIKGKHDPSCPTCGA